MAEVMPAPILATCEVCGLPLGLRYWIVDYPRAVHHECRDWSAARWPFGHVEAALRRALRGDVDDVTRRAARRLARDLRAARARWPENGRAAYDTLEPRCRSALSHLRTR